MVASTMATESLETLAAIGGPRWFQLYVFRDRKVTQALVERAANAGYTALQVTVDVPVMGRREADMIHQFELPSELQVANLLDAGHGSCDANAGESGPARYTRYLFDPNLSWHDIEWLVSISPIPVLVKGILRGDDAARAVRCGAHGVVVSNHGGRQLDTSIATIDALEDIVANCPKQTVILDGGIRRGTDIFKALALGASLVQVGRPVLWGLAVAGEDGVLQVLQALRDELDNAMALCGTPTIASITRDFVV
jgi:4-hydroxymandelate oxidase